jgi:hypothetical protein
LKSSRVVFAIWNPPDWLSTLPKSFGCRNALKAAAVAPMLELSEFPSDPKLPQKLQPRATSARSAAGA